MSTVDAKLHVYHYGKRWHAQCKDQNLSQKTSRGSLKQHTFSATGYG